MIIKIKTKPNSGRCEIIPVSEDEIKVYLKKSPEKNKANEELIKLLKNKYKSKYIKIIKGRSSRKKIVEVD